MNERIEIPWNVVHVCIYVRAQFGIFTNLLNDSDAVPTRMAEHSDVWYLPKKYVPNYLRAIRMYNMMNESNNFTDVVNTLEKLYGTNK